MSILDNVTGAVSDFMDDGKLNGSTGGGSNPMAAVTDAIGGASGIGDIGSMLMSHLGGDHMKQLTDLLSGMHINPTDLMSKLSADQIPMVGDLLKNGNMDGLKDMIGSLMGGTSK